MKQFTSRRIILALLIVLTIGFGAMSYLSALETEQLRTFLAQGWNVDGPTRHMVGAYHAILIPLIVAVAVAKRYYVATILSLIYATLHVWSTYLRLQGCFLGGDLCPSVPILTKAVDRLNWFDWSATLLIPAIFLWLLVLLLSSGKWRLP